MFRITAGFFMARFSLNAGFVPGFEFLHAGGGAGEEGGAAADGGAEGLAEMAEG